VLDLDDVVPFSYNCVYSSLLFASVCLQGAVQIWLLRKTAVFVQILMEMLH
jgi:hypothetical protein